MLLYNFCWNFHFFSINNIKTKLKMSRGDIEIRWLSFLQQLLLNINPPNCNTKIIILFAFYLFSTNIVVYYLHKLAFPKAIQLKWLPMQSTQIQCHHCMVNDFFKLYCGTYFFFWKSHFLWQIKDKKQLFIDPICFNFNFLCYFLIFFLNKSKKSNLLIISHLSQQYDERMTSAFYYSDTMFCLPKSKRTTTTKTTKDRSAAYIKFILFKWNGSIKEHNQTKPKQKQSNTKTRKSSKTTLNVQFEAVHQWRRPWRSRVEEEVGRYTYTTLMIYWLTHYSLPLLCNTG